MRLFRVYVRHKGESDLLINPVEIIKGYRNACRRFWHLVDGVNSQRFHGNVGEVKMLEFKDWDFSYDGFLLGSGGTEIKVHQFNNQ
ncbi:hypothetical protein [Sodaliphilus pleomorphus]|uniref:Uncharacterized protein n=1 Tax=Sodaliphilus pleomorphus TaxID=2606626 RepID=A0A6L5XDB4_9BACT|nr:hypothetical protein [Sodaliphilus pleomorphus]MSS16814.1 hypothetical protein [Sodaliphilus pleomorphus]